MSDSRIFETTFFLLLMLRSCCFILFLFITHVAAAQQQYELNSGWKCRKAGDVTLNGAELSAGSSPLHGWMPATVPGTVLTTLLNNKLVPDPFFGMNNELIPDIYTAGSAYYTYWFVNDFIEPPYGHDPGDRVYLDFRGVNYSFDVYLNGHKLNDRPETGMFLRTSFDITALLSRNDSNRLAVIVYPPQPAGNPNGGQGGDGMIAHNITNQFTAGWDWIPPIHDRNTGIWDKVFIRRTGVVHLENTHVVTTVPGKRNVNGKQRPAFITITTEIENTSDSETIKTVLKCEVAGKTVNETVTLEPHIMQEVTLPEIQIDDPKLWWPNGYGAQDLYPVKLSACAFKEEQDEEEMNIGIRQITTRWNAHTQSREICVNGQKIFVKGGNWILTDAMLRLDSERYDNEIRMHRDMNLNLIRVWGGGITERPEFYNACDKYGLLVMQDFWVSGDCNGRWYDPLKAEDTNARRSYPDDHRLFITALEDQIKMLRNHPSLAIWCGGNEIRPPADVLQALKDTLLPRLDGTRYFFEFSNDDSMSLHGGDGPYVIQDDRYFWQHRSFPFNSEIGSVGLGDKESLDRIMPLANMSVPHYAPEQQKWITDSVWDYHHYTGYDSVIEAYGHAKDITDFTRKAQLVNYNQYRALEEGAAAKMWSWYTGIIIWKTQNPWSAMKGQMYDCYLDQNACLYGTAEGAKPVHIMYDPVAKSAMVVNNRFLPCGLTMEARAYTHSGTAIPIWTCDTTIPASTSVTVHRFGRQTDSLAAKEGVFLYLCLRNRATNETVDENIYWLPDSKGLYSGLGQMPAATISITARAISSDSTEVTMSNAAGGTLAFFNRISLVDAITKKRILPAFYSDNYITVLPGTKRKVTIACKTETTAQRIVCVEGMNVGRTYVQLTK